MKTLHQYQNGNVSVTILEDGTKIREWPDDTPQIVTNPESCDLKITQYCDMDAVCQYCHEMSNKQGRHGDLKKIAKIWSTQFPGTELAIGGGNPLAHPDLEWFLTEMKNHGIICNLTVNSLHLQKFLDTLIRFQKEKLIHGLGLSYRGKKSFKIVDGLDYSNVVHHMILGLHTFDDLAFVYSESEKRSITAKVLLLGYKSYGNGGKFKEQNPEISNELNVWSDTSIPKVLMLMNNEGFKNLVLSFDNLAISQLKLQNHLSQKAWDAFYQGDDGSHTFYVDAVKEEVARTSTSEIRFSYSENDTICDLFNKVKLH